MATRATDSLAALEHSAERREDILRHLHSLQEELEGQSWLASTGEMAGPLTHEFNNFLNVVLLHVALMEAEVPEKIRSELAELRRQAASVAAVVKQFQQLRRRPQPSQESVPLNQIVGDAVRALAASPSESSQPVAIKLPPNSRIEAAGVERPAVVPLTMILTSEAPLVCGAAGDLKRLCTFLLTNAAVAAATIGGSVTLQTESSENKVFLRVEDGGPSVPSDLLPQLFEPSTVGRAGTSSLELAACESIVRRLQGKIRCANRPEGGLVVTVELPRVQTVAGGG